MPARSRKTRSTPSPAVESPSDTPPPEASEDGLFTGRYLVLLSEGGSSQGAKALNESAGIKVAAAGDDDEVTAAIKEGANVYLDKLGVAVVDAPPDQMAELSAAAADESNSNILAVEPERICYAGGGEDETRRIMEAFAAGAKAVCDYISRGGGESGGPGESEFEAALADSAQYTWGLQATRVPTSRYSGAGIKVCVLDTGMDLGHPDFAGRPVVSRSFVTGQAVQDGNGHGTHCIGTACGPRIPRQLPRYGIAYGCQIHAGKVLSNGGSGGDAGILAGINWAMGLRCAVISMSLGARPGSTFSAVYEAAATRVLNAGGLIVAAAGNDSARPGTIAPVSHPANCPSVLAVAAVDSNMRIASFSNGGLNPNGGKVDVAAPGVAVRSSWPRPLLYKSIPGTSMATPHVAGIAALLAQSNSALRGRALWQAVIQHVRALNLPARDVGAGLVQAPQ